MIISRLTVSSVQPAVAGVALASEGIDVSPNVPTFVAKNMFIYINPNESGFSAQSDVGIGDCPSPCPSGGSGGRVNGLSAMPGNPTTYFAASEIGGLFKTAWLHAQQAMKK